MRKQQANKCWPSYEYEALIKHTLQWCSSEKSLKRNDITFSCNYYFTAKNWIGLLKIIDDGDNDDVLLS